MFINSHAKSGQADDTPVEKCVTFVNEIQENVYET